MAKNTVKFKFVGHSGVRQIGDYIWSPENGHEAEVDVDTAATLINYRGGSFVPAERPSPAIRKAIADKLGIDVKNLVWPAPDKDEDEDDDAAEKVVVVSAPAPADEPDAAVVAVEGRVAPSRRPRRSDGVSQEEGSNDG